MHLILTQHKVCFIRIVSRSVIIKPDRRLDILKVLRQEGIKVVQNFNLYFAVHKYHLQIFLRDSYRIIFRNIRSQIAQAFSLQSLFINALQALIIYFLKFIIVRKSDIDLFFFLIVNKPINNKFSFRIMLFAFVGLFFSLQAFENFHVQHTL